MHALEFMNMVNNLFRVFGTNYVPQDKDVNECSITDLNYKLLGAGIGFWQVCIMCSALEGYNWTSVLL